MMRKRECILLTECDFYTELLDHPTVPREVAENDIKTHACGFVEGFVRNGGQKGKWLFKNGVLMNILLNPPLVLGSEFNMLLFFVFTVNCPVEELTLETRIFELAGRDSGPCQGTLRIVHSSEDDIGEFQTIDLGIDGKKNWPNLKRGYRVLRKNSH